MGKDSNSGSNESDVLGSRLRKAEEKIKKLENTIRGQQLQITNDAIDRINDDRDIAIGVLELVNKDLKHENQILREVIRETLWMAKRYANGRSTFAPTTVNEAIDALLKLGVELRMDSEDLYVEDGMFGKWNPQKKGFEGE
jgi:hypothetical protein